MLSFQLPQLIKRKNVMKATFQPTKSRKAGCRALSEEDSSILTELFDQLVSDLSTEFIPRIIQESQDQLICASLVLFASSLANSYISDCL